MKLETCRRKCRHVLENIEIGKDFINRTPFAQKLRTTVDKWNFIKLKSFFTAREAINLREGKPTEWERVFASSRSDRKLISKIL